MNYKICSYKKLILQIALILSITIFVGCSTNQNQGTKSGSYSASNMVDSAIENEKAELAQLKLERKEEFDKMYANDLSLEDLEEIKLEFDKKYNEYLYSLFEEEEIPIAFTSDIEFYNLSLKNAKEGMLTFEDVILNPGEHIRNSDIFVSSFQEESYFRRLETKSVYKVLKNIWQTYNESGVVSTEIIWTTYDSSVLESESIDNLDSVENPIIYLEPYKKCISRNVFTNYGMDSYKKNLGSTQAELDALAEAAKSKYQEEFIGIIDLKGEGISLCAPIDDYSLAFETDGNKYDKYITLIAQKRMYEIVDQILIDEGLEDDVVTIVTAKDYDNFDITGRKLVKPREVNSLILRKEEFFGDFDIVFYYLKEKINDVDYLKLKQCSTRIDDVATEIKFEYYYKTLNFFVLFYEFENETDKKVIMNTSKNEYLSNRYFSKSEGMNGLYSRLYTIENGSERCLMTQLYGEKLDHVLVLVGSYEEFSIEDFIDKSKRENIFQIGSHKK